MAKYLTLGQLKARLPYTGSKLTATSEPSESDAEGWIDEGEKEVETAIRAIGGSLPTDDHRMKMVGIHVGDYAEARLRLAWAASGGDDDNEDGQDTMKQYLDWLADLRADPSYWGGVFSTPSGVAAPTTFLRGTTDEQTYPPEFIRTERF